MDEIGRNIIIIIIIAIIFEVVIISLGIHQDGGLHPYSYNWSKEIEIIKTSMGK